MNQIYGRKIGMTRVFTDAGESVPVTVLECAPNVVCQVKESQKQGYNAIQVGLGEQKPQRVNRPAAGQMRAAQHGVFRVLKEIRLEEQAVGKPQEFKVGDELKLEGLFEVGAHVDVIGTSVGKGFAGVMKRHHMAGFPMTRGTHEFRRHGGAIGCRKFPGRVFKNKRMPGHMGVDRVAQLGLEVVSVRAGENLLLVRGSVPGPKNGIVLVRSAIKG